MHRRYGSVRVAEFRQARPLLATEHALPRVKRESGGGRSAQRLDAREQLGMLAGTDVCAGCCR